MTLEQIGNWCMERINLKRVHEDYMEHGKRTIHAVEWENGDSYIQEEEYNEAGTEKYIKIKLNGVIDYAARMIWHNFGWREAV